MSWTAPVTRATGYIVLATDWNAIENNLLLVDRIYGKKTTTKSVSGTTTATDLLNGEFTIAAGDMSTDRIARLTAWGEWDNGTGSAKDLPKFRLALGGTTLLDTGQAGVNVCDNVFGSMPWRFVYEIQNLGAANSQQSYITGRLWLRTVAGGAPGKFDFVTGNAIGIVPADISGGGGFNIVTYDGSNTSAVDTTAACALTLKVVNDSSSGSYETQLNGAVLELL